MNTIALQTLSTGFKETFVSVVRHHLDTLKCTFNSVMLAEEELVA
jgi:hypothetical protein